MSTEELSARLATEELVHQVSDSSVATGGAKPNSGLTGNDLFQGANGLRMGKIKNVGTNEWDIPIYECELTPETDIEKEVLGGNKLTVTGDNQWKIQSGIGSIKIKIQELVSTAKEERRTERDKRRKKKMGPGTRRTRRDGTKNDTLRVPLSLYP